MLDAALAYAARGWPVFPCDAGTKRPLVAALPGEPKGSGGLKRATTTEDVIRGWWKKWPNAMIGLPTGAAIGCYVVDIDAGTDDKTGEVFEAAPLLAALEAEIGDRLPETWLSETPRGGWHLFFPHVEGIGNRTGVVPRVDIRGEGGYVVAPPSVRADGRAYRWVAGPASGKLPAAAPAALVDCILRHGKWDRSAAAGKSSSSKTAADPSIAGIDAAIRKYALSAFDAEIRRLASAPGGTRNATLNEVAFALGQLVGAGVLAESMVRAAIEDVARAWPNFGHSRGTIDSGLRAGMALPRDLREVKAKAKRRAEAPRSRVLSGALPPIDEPPPAETGAPRPGDQLELRDILRQRRRRVDPAPLERRGGAAPGQWTPDRLGLPKEDPCPVIPLGIEGRRYYFLDSAGQLAEVAASQLNHAGIQDLYAAEPNWPEWACPRYGKAKKIYDEAGSVVDTIIPIESFKDDEIRKMLFRACQRKGLFSLADRVRGRGAWKRDDGTILYHAGEELWIVEGGRIRAIESGLLHDGGRERVFPRMPSLSPPWPKPVEPADNPARQLIAGLKKWNWERPDVDPLLFLGWIGVAFMGGALDWRSAVFLIGDKGTGKSELQRLTKALFGDALLDSANTTAAGIYQQLAQDTRPVAVDEIEAGADNRKVVAIVELARQASSGAFGRRGASDARSHGVEFQMRSAFLFSAINNPPLLPQDLSRLAMLRLRALDPDAGGAPVIVDADTCGRKVLTRLMLEWHRFPATLKAYREALAGGGHVSRGQDTYGTLLACADLIIGAELAEELGIPMSEDLSPWSTLLHVDTLPEVQDAIPNWRSCLNHLFQSRVATWRSGERATVGQLIEDLDDRQGDSAISPAHAKRQLAQAGLGLAKDGRGWLLAVPNQSPLLEQLFMGSRWQGMPGAGGWSEALRQGPGDVISHEAQANRVQINGVQQRCTLIVLGRRHEIDARRPAPAPDQGLMQSATDDGAGGGE